MIRRLLFALIAMLPLGLLAPVALETASATSPVATWEVGHGWGLASYQIVGSGVLVDSFRGSVVNTTPDAVFQARARITGPNGQIIYNWTSWMTILPCSIPWDFAWSPHRDFLAGKYYLMIQVAEGPFTAQTWESWQVL